MRSADPRRRASTHSWRNVFPQLATQFQTVAIDLPGHGFSRVIGRNRSSLPKMAQALGELIEHEGLSPAIVIGQFAGVAVALEMARTGRLAPDTRIIAINGALSHFGGLAGVLFPALAKLFAASPLTAMLFSRSSTPAQVDRLLKATGSKIDAEGARLYGALFSSSAHVDGALMMMAQWNLDALIKHLPKIAHHVSFLTGANDKTVPPQVSANAAARMPHASHKSFDGLGHLLHEERPELILDAVSEALVA